MLFKDINQKFTDKVAEYIQKGLLINTGTMQGWQNELAKVDLTDGKDIYRIMLETEYENGELGRCGTHMTCLIVGKSRKAENLNSRFHSTVWNNELEILEREDFYKLGTKKNGDYYYGTREEYLEASKKKYERHLIKISSIPYTIPITSEKTVNAVLPYLKRKRDGRRINRNMVEVYRTTQADGRNDYSVEYYSYSYHLA